MTGVPDEALYKAVFDTSSDAQLIIDREGAIQFANERAHELFGWDLSTLIGQPIELLVPVVLRESHRALRKQFVEHPSRRTMGAGLELSGRRRDGSEFPADISLSPLRWQGQTLIVASVRDESERRGAEREAQHVLDTLAQRDPLTRLLNRNSLDEGLARAVANAKAENRSLAVIMCDIDHFKRVNSVCGHAVGDEVLLHVARTLESVMRQSDLVCRYGGGEFVVVMPGADLGQARKKAEVVAQRIREVAVPLGHAEIGPITLSFGISASPEHGFFGRDLLDHADRALQRAKADGRNCIRLAAASENSAGAAPDQ